MKLYATVTSERASKGQGGEYLEISTSGKNKEPLWHISLLPVGGKEGEYSLIISLAKEAKKEGGSYPYIFTDTIRKGKRQKGEYIDEICPKYNEQVLPDENGMCSLCGEHKASNY